jgi:hypothetical protein
MLDRDSVFYQARLRGFGSREGVRQGQNSAPLLLGRHRTLRASARGPAALRNLCSLQAGRLLLDLHPAPPSDPTPARLNPTPLIPHPQGAGESELEVMFRVSRLPPDDMWRAREGVSALRERMNARARRMITEWLEKKGVAVVPGPGARVKRRDAYLRRRLQGGGPSFRVGADAGAAAAAASVASERAAGALAAPAAWAAGAARGAAARLASGAGALLPRPSRK